VVLADHLYDLDRPLSNLRNFREPKIKTLSTDLRSHLDTSCVVRL